jgi:ankyrin repeat protein
LVSDSVGAMLVAIRKARVMKTPFEAMLAEALASKADPNTRDALGFTPLMLAALENNAAAAAVLVEAGAVLSATNTAGLSAMFFASLAKADSVLKLLTEKNAKLLARDEAALELLAKVALHLPSACVADFWGLRVESLC